MSKDADITAKEVNVTGENVHVAGQDTSASARERKEIRLEDAATAKDIRDKDYRRLMFTLLLAAIPTFLTAAGGVYVLIREVNAVKTITVGTHELVNSGSLAQLKVNLRSSRQNLLYARRVFLLSKDPEDEKSILDAERDLQEAEKLIIEHEAKQILADKASGKYITPKKETKNDSGSTGNQSKGEVRTKEVERRSTQGRRI